MKESWDQMVDAIENATTVKQAAVKLIEEMRDRLQSIADHPTAEQVR